MKSTTRGRNILWALFGVAASISLTGCNRSAAQQSGDTAPPEVLTAQAKPAGDSYELRLPARTVAGETARLFPRATGFVSERRVDLGDRVTAGQVLAVISAPEIDQAVRETQADVLQARADLELARTNYERAERLVQSQVISRELYSDRLAARDASRAALASAEARWASARERQGFQVMRAPFAGVISQRNVERGDRVVGDSAAATAPLFEINALDPLRIVVDVPQSVALQVRPGLQADVDFVEMPGERFKAEVVRSAQSISDAVGGMRVELRLPNPEGRIPAGMVGQVRLSVPRTAPAVVLPISAVLQGADGARVALLKDSVVNYRPVRLGRNLGNEVEVVEGLAAGETVVLSPNALLAAGSRVRVKPSVAAKS
ncbi:efflux RND transporter periplasmic adaptor subunit [Pseudoxanthomonas sp. UTMC 1351]|uniref:efflux RND transporter periplasmic adaptor subunit n=1 Tax=Pseudoxanthomonas sp. UTMC 1351 TaxID=2695853 RepID=UPI0034CECFA0